MNVGIVWKSLLWVPVVRIIDKMFLDNFHENQSFANPLNVVYRFVESDQEHFYQSKCIYGPRPNMLKLVFLQMISLIEYLIIIYLRYNHD